MPDAPAPRACRRAPAALHLLALAVAAGCALPVGPAPAGGAFTPAPAPGDGPGAVRAAVEATPDAGTRIEIVEWRELAVRDGALLPPGDAGTGDGHALLVHRRCVRRTGWTGRREVERSSWYLLRQGRLVAFDHPAFDARCGVRWHLRPAEGDDRSVEQALARYLGQRHPAGAPTLAERIERTAARLDAGRGERAADALETADREIARLRERLGTGGLGEEARLAHQEDLDALQAARTRLIRAMRARDGDGRETARDAREAGDASAPAAGSLLKPGAPAPRPASP